MGSVGKLAGNEETRANIGYDDRRMANIERIRENSETRRITEEARREEERGSRNWTPQVGERVSNVSEQRARNEIFNAPIGTVITMDNHNTGDYVGEYTRTITGWEGSQRYKSPFVRPRNVATAEGFAMQVGGNDIQVLKVGSVNFSEPRRRRKR